MVFSSDDKAIITNNFEEKRGTAYRIWKEHQSKILALSSVQHLIKRFKATKTIQYESLDLED